ncbi:MAG: ATP-dependent DNA helicase RecG [Spirochaetales bacterium]|nr:ATP-dependent DNA helicase RecG [Spirochaetales bacterium]MCF7937075.1 ATP-dependent DNA helicase RecG [Spirochaetales bacterium]
MFLRQMRQPVLDVKGVGRKTASALERLDIRTIGDLLVHYPRSYENRKDPVPLVEAHRQGYANTTVRVLSQEYFGWGRDRTLKVTVSDETDTASLVCFGRNFLERVLLPGKFFFLYGSFQMRYGELQSSSFDTEAATEEDSLPARESSKRFGRILPLYPLTTGLSQQHLRNAVGRILQGVVRSVEDEIPSTFREFYGFLPKNRALREIHFPETMQNMELARKSLIYEELFGLQLTVALRAERRKQEGGKAYQSEGNLCSAFFESLPFEPTADQKRVHQEIIEDALSPEPAARLLQGDVGSGKTLVALTGALHYIEAGGQAAFLAPTELLAKQHAERTRKSLEGLGVRTGFLSGSLPEHERHKIQQELQTGEIQLVIGTHALFSEQVHFKHLAFVIIDEQQRFGVLQRLKLTGKGYRPDTLLLTATPIPRTLTMTAFGDLRVSVIKTMPPGRKPVETHLAKIGNEQKVYDFVERELQAGHQAYFVYPLINKSDRMELKDAQQMHQRLAGEIFPDYRVELVHSRKTEEEKEKIMADFAKGDVDILVATSVVEVGVDVANATCMVVEHAERFGLSALHQLRGRVGRSGYQSFAFLVYHPDLTDAGKERLRVMKESNDGFVIAEKDLAIRGPGDLSGTRQSGFIRFTIAELVRDSEVLVQAKKDVETLMKKDPGLEQEDSAFLRRLMKEAPPFPEEPAGTA